jgi:putative transcriptional regulator
MPYSKIERGTLLVATPDIDMGVFFRSVILVCEHTPHGSFGVVINKNLNLDLPEEYVDLSALSNPHISIRSGGPVQTSQMMLLHQSEAIPNQTLKICENVYLGGDLQFLQTILTDDTGPNVALCFGYTGWAGGQLEREFMDGQWLLHPAKASLIFQTRPEELWQHILRDMGGKYASMSMIPEDLSLN